MLTNGLARYIPIFDTSLSNIETVIITACFFFKLNYNSYVRYFTNVKYQATDSKRGE